MRFSRAEASDANAISALALDTCERFLFDDMTEEGQDNLRQLYDESHIKERIEFGDRFVLAVHGTELAAARICGQVTQAADMASRARIAAPAG